MKQNKESYRGWYRLEREGTGPYFAMLLTTNNISHCMITTNLLNPNLNPFFLVRVINKDYKASDFGYSCARQLI
jgi:hypothetical protein